MSSEDISTLIGIKSAEHKLKFDLVASIISVESSNEPWTVRYESGWRYLFFQREFADQLNITVQTETILQSTSWGLMQIMGSVARERGFRELLTKLLIPENNLEFGCRQLVHLQRKYEKETDVISSYNAGSVVLTRGGMYQNQGYVDKVWQKLVKCRKLK